MTPRRPLIVCVRETPPEGREAINELVAIPADGSAAPRGDRLGQRLLLLPAHQPRRRQGWPGPAGITRACPGTAPSYGWPTWRPTGTPGARAPRGRRDPPSRSSSRRGAPRACCTSSPTAPAGGTSTASAAGAVEPWPPMEAEFGQPQWVFGHPTYAFLADGRIACAYRPARAPTHLAMLSPPMSGQRRAIGERLYRLLRAAQRWAERSYCVAAQPTRSAAAGAPATPRPASPSAAPEPARGVDPGLSRSAPQAIEFPTEEGLTAHAFYYPPGQPGLRRRPDERPPLIVMSHGGPDRRRPATLDLEIQYWTSRGLRRGGRQLRRQHRLWPGLPPAAQRPVGHRRHGGLHQRRALPGRGGESMDPRAWPSAAAAPAATPPCARWSSTIVFAAGASYYGVADAEALAADTHKFESRYLRPADRALSRGAATSTWRARRSTSPTGCPAR